MNSSQDNRIKALIEVGKKLTSGIRLTEKEVFELIYEQASEKLGMKNLLIALYDENTDTVQPVLASVKGMRVDVEKEPGWEPRKGCNDEYGKTEKIIRRKKYLLLNTREEITKTAFSPIPGHKNYEGRTPNSWLGVPMMFGDKVLGVIAIYDYGKDYLYNADDVEILQSLADQAAIALENIRLFQDKEKLVNGLRDAQKGIADRERELVISGFSMDIIHKMNNMAGTIPAWVSLIRRKLKSSSNFDPKVIEYLDKINQDAQLLIKEANELREPISEPENIDMEDVIGSIVAQVEMMLSPDIKIVFNDPEYDLFFVYGVKEQIAVAIYSVIQNGIKRVFEK